MFQRVKEWLGLSDPAAAKPQRELRRKFGRIIFFNRKKGYGFINSPEIKKDIFVHASELKDFVRRGDQVSFQLEEEKRGPKAVEVERMETA